MKVKVPMVRAMYESLFKNTSMCRSISEQSRDPHFANFLAIHVGNRDTCSCKKQF